MIAHAALRHREIFHDGAYRTGSFEQITHDPQARRIAQPANKFGLEFVCRVGTRAGNGCGNGSHDPVISGYPDMCQSSLEQIQSSEEQNGANGQGFKNNDDADSNAQSQDRMMLLQVQRSRFGYDLSQGL
jgi:hypothetical protein